MNNILPRTPYEVQDELDTSDLLLWHTPSWMGLIQVLVATERGVHR